MLNPKNCKPGQEQYDYFYSDMVKKNRIQYDYRHTDGDLFSTVAATLKACRERRDEWLEQKAQTATR